MQWSMVSVNGTKQAAVHFIIYNYSYTQLCAIHTVVNSLPLTDINKLDTSSIFIPSHAPVNRWGFNSS